jgi:hypothetical protein
MATTDTAEHLPPSVGALCNRVDDTLEILFRTFSDLMLVVNGANDIRRPLPENMVYWWENKLGSALRIVQTLPTPSNELKE